MDRRTVLVGGSALAALTANTRFLGGSQAFAAANFDTTTSFPTGYVESIAKDLATRPFAKPGNPMPQSFRQLSYDQFRDVRFRTDQAIWRGEKIDFEVQLLPMGWLFDAPVEVWLVDAGTARRIVADKNLFSFGPLVGDVDAAAPYGLSGFRIHGPINRPDYFDEYMVFQGASYFRGVGRGQVYGLSARGLAIDTAQPGGEEFPIFRAFWLERPKAGARTIVVHALLDSSSTSGAYRFEIEPGESTIVDVEATLYPRRKLTNVGIAPLTSMFLFGPGFRRFDRDFRPAVHDSDGLAIYNGNSECIWRPLTNPRTLQTSAFMDRNLKGFGLCQRGRTFHDYEDLEARYEKRPTVWIEPKGSWGAGYVELIEIPTDEEIHDNIVAYWKPSGGAEPGTPFTVAYRMYWTDDIPVAWSGARAVSTRTGDAKPEGSKLFVVDFAGSAVAGQRQMPVAAVTANPGTVANVIVHPNPEIDGVRVSFELNPAGTDLCELRLALMLGDRQISETWLYRWTRT